MTSTLSIALDASANRDLLVQSFMLPYNHLIKKIRISSDIQDHDYPVHVDNGIFISHQVVRPDANYYMLFFASQLATTHCFNKNCPVNNKEYPYFYRDSKIVYVVPRSDSSSFDDDILYEFFDIHIHDDVSDINIYRHIDKKSMAISDVEFNRIYGDNVELKNHCRDLLKRMSMI